MRRRSFLGLALVLALASGLQSSASPTPPPGFINATDWRGAGPRFGGFSSIAVAPDGKSFLSVSDHGAWTRGTFTRDAQDKLTGITNGAITPLLDAKGKALTEGNTDSEGMALAPDGGMYVSFEGPARVRHYAQPGSASDDLPSAREFAAMKHNSSLETLCIGEGGRLYTIPEISGGGPSRPFPVFRFQNGKWGSFGTVPRSDEFETVDCSIGPDGRFYLLKRAFYGLGGFASRLERFEIGTKGLTGRTVLFQTEPGTFDDLEGLSVWRDKFGKLRATTVSDDNFSMFFVTQIVEFALPD
jgi:hypothetical protein